MHRLLEFMNTHSNWRELLAAPPRCIKASDQYSADGAHYYTILKYNQYDSDFSDIFVQMSRGSIFYQDPCSGLWECVCHPFDKFGNYGESYVPEIDWQTARVQEKIDGSLIKMWYHGGWHISTNGMVDARAATCQNDNFSYYELVMRALEKFGNPQDFFRALMPGFTYMFELVSPENRMTIPYPEDRLYILGARDNYNHYESQTIARIVKEKVGDMLLMPKTYSLHSLAQCIAAVEAMGADEEGFVVVDNNYNRVKIKSPEYLIASHLRFNNSITVKKIIKIARDGRLDDFLAYSSDYAERVERVLDVGRCYAANMEADWRMLSKLNILSKKDFYQAVKYSPYCDFLCKKYDAKYSITAAEWLGQLPLDKITEIIEEELEIDGRGEEEYE